MKPSRLHNNPGKLWQPSGW